jgi:hypothetical protein
MVGMMEMVRRSNRDLNTKKKVIDHTTGSHGYAGKEEIGQEHEEKAIQSGATLAIAN